MKKAFLLILVVGLVIGLVLSGCAPTTPSTTGPQEILLGAAAPLTGMAASFGQGGSFGLKAAVEDINKIGGVSVKEYNRKLPVKLILLDNESDALKAGTLAESLVVKDKVNFLVSGPQWPQEIAAIANVAEKYKTPYVNNAGPFEPTNALRMSAGPWKYVWMSGFAIGAPPPPGDFRNKPGYTMMDLWMAYLGQFRGKTNNTMAAFAADDPDGRGWYEAFTKALKGAGFTVIGAEKELGLAPLNTVDFTSVIKQWKDNNAEILIGNAPGPWIGTLWRQCSSLQFKPKIMIAERGAMMYQDVVAWGGDLPWGVTFMVEWVPAIKAPGIGDATPQSLSDRWTKSSGQPTHQLLGAGYAMVQILIDAIQRAGTLDKDKVNAALAQTDLMTIRHRAKYDENQFNRFPICFGQWAKVDPPQKWETKVIYSQHDFYPVTGQPIFPLP